MFDEALCQAKEGCVIRRTRIHSVPLSAERNEFRATAHTTRCRKCCRVCGLQLISWLAQTLTRLIEGDLLMATMQSSDDRDENRDPITGEPGAHPVGAGVGAAVGGAAAGAAVGMAAGPVGTVAGAVIGGVAGGLAGKAVAEQIDPTIEEHYWRNEYATREILRSGRRLRRGWAGVSIRLGIASRVREPEDGKRSSRICRTSGRTAAASRSSIGAAPPGHARRLGPRGYELRRQPERHDVSRSDGRPRHADAADAESKLGGQVGDCTFSLACPPSPAARRSAGGCGAGRLRAGSARGRPC